jgi:hypothetical protein
MQKSLLKEMFWCKGNENFSASSPGQNTYTQLKSQGPATKKTIAKWQASLNFLRKSLPKLKFLSEVFANWRTSTKRQATQHSKAFRALQLPRRILP